MANGERVHVGAVAYNDIPLGTEIYIGDRRYVVKDRCAYDGVVDIYMSTVQECIEYGRRMEVIMIGCENNANAGTWQVDSCGEQRDVQEEEST